MSVKYFDKEKGEWKIFPGVNGMSAYDAAKLGGFSGSEDEFNEKLAKVGNGFLTETDADSKYEPLMNASKELFKVKSQDGSVNPFTYGSTLDLSAIDVEVEVSDDYTVFAYHYSRSNPGAPSGGGVDTSYSILYPKDWYGSGKVDE